MPILRRKRKYKKNTLQKSRGIKRRTSHSLLNKRRKSASKRKNSTVFSSRSARKRVKKKLGLLVYAIVALILTFLVSGGYIFYKFANAPFSAAAGVDYNDSNQVWNNDEVTLVIAKLDDINDKYSEINKLGLIYFDVPSKRYVIYDIPVDIEVEYALNAGTGTFRRIYAVGNADQNRGAYLLQKTLLKLFAIHTDGYVFTDNYGYSQMENLIGTVDPNDLSASLRLKNIPKIPQFISTFRKSCITNLKFKDILAIDKFIRSTAYSSSNVVKLNKYHLLDTNNWDSIWQKRRGLSPVKAEGIKVFVANASNPKVPGLAQWGSRVVKNIGADVLEEDNSAVEFNQNTIVTTDATLLTVRKLENTLGIKNIIVIDDNATNKNYNPQVYRTKVSLFLTNF